MMRGNNDRWKPEEVNKLLEMFERGDDYTDIAKHFNRSRIRTMRKVQELRRKGKTSVYRINPYRSKDGKFTTRERSK